MLTLCVQNDKGVPSSCYKNAFYSSLRAVFAKNGVAIHEFKRKFTFGLPRICTLTLCKFSQWRIPCHTYKFFRIDLIFVIPTALLSYWAFGEVSINPLHCHTERSEVSTNSKAYLKFYGFFAIAQNDKIFICQKNTPNLHRLSRKVFALPTMTSKLNSPFKLSYKQVRFVF